MTDLQKKSVLSFLTISIIAIFFVGLVQLPISVVSESDFVPKWIKNVAGFWSNDQISDTEYVEAMQYLINAGIMQVSEDTQSTLQIDSITIGFIPVEKAEELNPRAEKLEKYLEDNLNGIDVKVVVPTNYETIIEGLRFGHIDAAFMDTGPGWIAHKRAGAEVVLAEVVDGKSYYQGTVYARATDDSIQSIEDTIGKKVAFTSITGSSGFIRPMGILVDQGLIDMQGNDLVSLEAALAKSFKSYTFAGGYKAALELLINGNVDVAFGSDIAPQKYLTAAEQTKLRIVEKIGPIPSHVFIVSIDMPLSAKKDLVSAMIGLNYDGNNEILREIYGAEALLPTTTTMHIGDFGKFIDSLAGMEQKILDKYNLSK